MIRFATEQDIDSIMNFINEHWKKDHILARDKKFFEFFHRTNTNVNYVISIENSIINGILGYIIYNDECFKDIMLTTWKVVSNENPILGMDMLQFLMNQEGVRVIASPGINEKVIPLYRWLGYKTGEMNQWYRLNAHFSKEDFKIGKIENITIETYNVQQYPLVEYKTYEELEASFEFSSYSFEVYKPYKSPEYFERRYFDFPIYQYRVFGIQNSANNINTLLVFRLQEYNNSNVLRLVDCIGNISEMHNVTSAIDLLVKETNSEYVDFYEVGMPEDIMINAGWSKVENSRNVIPNYFSPFLLENIKIYYSTTDEDVVLFKADGDQDRPN